MFDEFKKFIARGNIMDLAIGIIIGGAFQKIVNSLVNDIISPGISMLTGKLDFSNLAFSIGNISINYGNFFNAILNFLITAITIFLIVKYINKVNSTLQHIPTFEIDKKSKRIVRKKSKEESPIISEPTTKVCPFCYSEISIKATRCPNCTSILEE